MSTKYAQAGRVMDYTNTTGVAIPSGGYVLVGSKVGHALTAIAIGATGSVQLCGVFKDAPKLTADVFTQGAAVYWDNTNKRFTLTSAGNTLGGNAWLAASGSDATFQVLLNGTPS